VVSAGQTPAHDRIDCEDNPPRDQFVIALHSPGCVLETGLLGGPPEKKAARPAWHIEQETFSGPLCVKDSRNYGQFERFHNNCRLFSLQGRPIAYSHSGRILAVAGETGTINLWRLGGSSAISMGRTAVPFKFYRAMDGQLSFERNDTLLIGSDGLRAAAAISLLGGRVSFPAQVLHNHPSPDDVTGDRATPYAVHPQRPIVVTARR
jgi:hypothetical protein